MNRLLKRSLVCATTACVIAGCGGGSVSDSIERSVARLTLNGNWFVEQHGPHGPVYGTEMLISEKGTDVVLTYCNRMTYPLTRSGSQLFDRQGKLSYLYVKDPETLASRLEGDGDFFIKKRSPLGRFDYGSIDLTLPSGEKVTASTDVCAETAPGRYGDSLGHEISPTVLSVSLPYRESFIRMEIGFRQLGNGRYKVIGFTPFVQGGANDATIADFYSPSLMTPDGGQAVVIASGTLEVSNYTGSAITLSADVNTVNKMPVKWTANVRLQQR